MWRLGKLEADGTLSHAGDFDRFVDVLDSVMAEGVRKVRADKREHLLKLYGEDLRAPLACYRYIELCGEELA